MTFPRYGGGENLLQLYGRAQAQAGVSGRVQSGHDQAELGHVGRRGKGRKKGERGTRYISQESKGTKWEG